MMKEYEYIIASTLRQKLIEKVNGGVKTWVTNDELFINIRLEECGILYELSVPNFAERILNGWTTDYAVYEILQDYRRFINSRFFR